jgi:hypothetical protein
VLARSKVDIIELFIRAIAVDPKRKDLVEVEFSELPSREEEEGRHCRAVCEDCEPAVRKPISRAKGGNEAGGEFEEEGFGVVRSFRLPRRTPLSCGEVGTGGVRKTILGVLGALHSSVYEFLVRLGCVRSFSLFGVRLRRGMSGTLHGEDIIP